MKIQKKSIIYMLLFIFVVVFAYFVIVSFSYNTLNFTPFYKSLSTSETIDEDKIVYSINNKNEIVFVINDKEDFIVYKIKDDNVSPKDIVSFKLDGFSNYNFINSDDYHFMFYNNDNDVVIINEENKSYNIYNNLPNGKKFINHNTNQIFLLNNYDINVLEINNSNELKSKYVLSISNEIKDIKNVEFINEEEIVVSTYNGGLFVVNITNNEVIKMNYFYHQYYVANDNLYYTYSTSDRKLGISIYDGKETNFSINPVDYLSIQVKTDYLYLISNDEIYKVSLSRMKQHETLQSSQYIDMTYSLNQVIIVNEHLMYIPMIKKEGDELLGVYYGYYLYRYKVK